MTNTGTNQRVTRSSTNRGAAPAANPPCGPPSRGGPASRRGATAGARQGNQVLQELQDRQVIFPRNGKAQAFAERMEAENSELRDMSAELRDMNAELRLTVATLVEEKENLKTRLENLEEQQENLQTAVKPTIGRKRRRLLRR